MKKGQMFLGFILLGLMILSILLIPAALSIGSFYIIQYIPQVEWDYIGLKTVIVKGILFGVYMFSYFYIIGILFEHILSPLEDVSKWIIIMTEECICLLASILFAYVYVIMANGIEASHTGVILFGIYVFAWNHVYNIIVDWVLLKKEAKDGKK
ncbi:hypothetical protein [Listeria booriae]|uniref:Uncharacterized protein n=2 Tax=Listeria booriae TaxID=1552123 RepID=A0A842B0R2_9LIST|nr:hypothetical protein [Listeria booriae]MBC1798573.1 hypothetical protein [Listeria booriae]MBC1813012.1 hypothetical protein [Listeria booriae]MBC1983163.1 hypothetical protein [Listeria booriae]